jgi:spermidine/putrescine ABC transporter ATP-binding subunit
MRVCLEGLSKRFGALLAVDGVELDIASGEFFTLLGPSGCGKTTLLRLVAGFVVPDSGEIRFGAQDMTRVPPHRRETGMVFQNYALFPQLSVFENVAYGLRARNVPREEIRRRVVEILASVRLEGLGDRVPGRLSGGQQQRVALARALIIRPRVLLMDEPLSNLDAKLRVGMREEIRRIQRSLGITTLYVTHDQEEAMAVSDRIAILSAGRLQQVGPPSQIYFTPRNRFVAEFMGACNLLEVRVVAYDAERRLAQTALAGRSLRLRAAEAPAGPTLTLLLRPEWIKLADRPAAAEDNWYRGRVRGATFLGSAVTYQVEAFDGQRLTVEVQDPRDHEIKADGEEVGFRFDVDRPVVVCA